uniref:dihydrofolate reductase family protein n=1 Tax=Sphingomonas sp. TaxID=28214 RepID=UPI00286B0B14
MRRIVGAAFVTLDGVMQGPGGPTEDPTGGFRFSGWLPPVGDEAIDGKIGEIFGRPFDLLLGRRTHDIFAAYWPYAPDEMADIRDPFNACTKYVVTHGDDPLAWENSERVSIEALRAIKQGDGPDLVIQGSSTLYPQLLDAGLLDELTLMMSPIILGQGKRLVAMGHDIFGADIERVADARHLVRCVRPVGGEDVMGAAAEQQVERS